MGAGEAEGRPQGAASLWLRKVTCIGGTAGRDRQPHGLQGQRDRGLGGGKAPEGEMVPGGWVWTKTGPPSWVKPLPSNPESHWCHCSHPPCLPKPAAPQHPWVLRSPPARQGSTGGTGHKSTLPPRSPAPGSQPSQTQVLSKGLISSSALCQPPDPKRSFLSVFPCAGATVLRRAISTGRSNVINRPETFSLGGAG